jgi:hypothetical protein
VNGRPRVTCGGCKYLGERTGEHSWRCNVKAGVETVTAPSWEACGAFDAKAQPAPTPNGLPRVHDLVLTDLEGRLAQGLRTYGVPLQPHNGRDALRDAYEEAIDLAFYLRQAIFERDGK